MRKIISKKIASMAIIALLFLAATLVLVIPSMNQAYAQSLNYRDMQDNHLVETRYFSRATLEDDFTDCSIIIVLDRATTRQFIEHTIYDFPEINIVSVNDLTGAVVGYVEQQLTGRNNLMQLEEQLSGRTFQVEEMKTDVVEFRRILQLELYERCRENVLRSIRVLERRPDIISAEPNFRIEPQSREPNDPGFTNTAFNPTDHWALRNMSLPGAWSFSTGRAGVVVGIVDTGINFGAHADLAGRMDARPDVHRHFMSGLSWNRSGVPENPFDVWVGPRTRPDGTIENRTGHGTQTAAIIGAAGNTGIGMTGINWDVRMVSLRVYDDRGGDISALIRAINYAASINIPILYLGFQGRSATNSQQNSIRSALNSFTGLAISAAGNHNRNIDNADTPTFPASIRTTRHISVGALNRDGTRAGFSNFGAESVHLWSYGTQVLSINANGAFQGFSGTSSAGPLVTGIAALLQSVHDSVTPYQIRDALLNNVDDLEHINGISVTDGRPNAHRAMAAVAFRTSNIGATGISIDGLRHGFTLPANTSLVIPEQINGRSVTQIAASAFANQTNLFELVIPSTVTAIATDAFNDNPNLTTVTFAPNSNLRRIGDAAFAFTNITNITLPPNLESIGFNAFYGTPLSNSQTGIVYADNWVVGTRGSGGLNASLRPNTIGIADFTFFYSNFALWSINLSNSLRFIGAGAFKNAPLSQITLPASLEQINSAAFMGSNIQRVVANRTTGAWPHQITQLVGTEHFAHTPANLTILVPACSYSAYRANHNWRNLNLRIYGSRTDVYINSTHQEILINFNQKGHIYNGRYYTDLRVRFMLQMNAFFSIAGYGAAAYVYNNTGTARLGVAYSGSNGTASVYNQTGQEVIVRLRLCALRGQNARLIINHAITNHGSNVNMGTYLNRDINIIYNSSSNPNSYNSLLFAPTVSGWYNFILWIGSTAESGGFYVYDMNDASIRHEVTQIHTQRTSIHLLAGRTYLLLVYARAFRSSVRAFNIYLTTPTSNPNPTTPSTQTATIDTYLSSVTLPSTRWQWVTPNAFLNTAGTHAFRARYTPSDSERYHIIYRDVIVSVVYRAPIFTTPTGLAAELGQLLHEINLPTNWTWTSPNTVVSTTGTPRFRARFSCGTPRTRPAYSYITLNVARPYIIPSGLTAEPSQYLRDLTLPTGWTWANPDTPVGAVGNRSFAARFTTNTQTPLVVNYNLSVRVTIFEQNRQLIFSGTLASPAIDIVGPPGEIIGPGFPVNPPLLPGLPPLLPGLPPPGVTPPPLLPPVYRPLNDCCADLYYDLEYSMSVVISCQCADGYMCACDNCACPRVFPPICECFFVGICTCPNCICGPIVFLPPEPCPPPSMAIPFTGSLSDIFNRSLYINISTIRSEVISTENSAFNNMHRFTFRDLVGFTQLSLDSISTRPIVICALSNSTLTITIESRRGLRDCGTTLESKLYTRATINTPHTNWTAPTNIWLV